MELKRFMIRFLSSCLMLTNLLIVRKRWLTLIMMVYQVGTMSHPQEEKPSPLPCTANSVRLRMRRGVLDMRKTNTEKTLFYIDTKFWKFSSTIFLTKRRAVRKQTWGMGTDPILYNPICFKSILSILKQGLRRTQKLRQCTYWKVNFQICQLSKASNIENRKIIILPEILQL